MDTYTHIYLAPHLDDAVLSCGGRIWHQTQEGESVLVATIFAGDPATNRKLSTDRLSTDKLSAFAHQLHARWGAPLDAVEERRQEDRAALSVLGAEDAHWPYPECIYRRGADGRFLYDSEASLWANVHVHDANEATLIAELTRRIAALPLGAGGVIYGPLGAGKHVDHQIVRQALTGAHSASRIIYYEDYPYAAQPRALQEALGNELLWKTERTPLSEAAMAAKIAAVAQYRSQLSTFWESKEEMEQTIRAFAVKTGEGKAAERYWRTISITTKKGKI